MMDRKNTSIPGLVSDQDADSKASAGDAQRKANRSGSKKWRFILVPAFIFIAVIIWGANDRGLLGTSGTTKSGSQGTVRSAPQVKAAAASIGTKVRDGE